MPAPALLGAHQILNAGLAIASLAAWPENFPRDVLARGVRAATWPARLQHLQAGPLRRLLPVAWELWLDGGHNDSAGEILAAQIAAWRREDGDSPRPLFVVYGMLTTKVPAEFLGPFAASVAALRSVPILTESLSQTPAALADAARALGIPAVAATSSVAAALQDIAQSNKDTPKARVLICGSLYLAGEVLRENGTV